MAVRFRPSPGDGQRPQGEDRGDLAEVLSLRSRLPQREWAQSQGDWAPESNEHSAEDSGTPSPPVQLDSISPSEPPDAPSDELAPAGEVDSAEPEPSGPERTANEDAVRVLGRKARSSGELRRDLERLGHDAHEVSGVIDEFRENLYLDDVGLARIVTEKLRDAKGASRGQIRRKLQERHFDESAIESALADLDEHEEDQLLRAAAEDRARRLTGLDPQTAERRLLGFLARRGWGGEPARRAARDALQGGGRSSSGVRFQ
ncbi:hypothetical protein GCM10009847_20190 [Leucobacter tardus]|uniref:Regulatory protein RecX n=1 Tax=Leucobacter tardus TaxID=501483 RepID=A0A939QEM1_9MICO|nr:regulatory protein RecX [Leucobacter tardus]MBO2990466.1 RecX family transcriptional regulator [Leucobacter tardus]